MSVSQFCDKSEIRARFSTAMSGMYQREVPQYGTLLQLVSDINGSALERNAALKDKLITTGELDRLNMERHGAIRVGTAQELAMLCRLFAVMGMQPVSYYDLAPAGVPVHATAFRAVDEKSLRKSPFRVFTSLLRTELIDDVNLREIATKALQARNIFTQRTLELVEIHESKGGLSEEEANEFVAQALETFRWHSLATVDYETFHKLQEQHRLIADVVAFKGPHINHLTPRTLDIDAAQQAMSKWGIVPKATIEGPPRRKIDILLRQTSFKALDEQIAFPSDSGEVVGSHSARFGEIEQRGAALTRKGRALYDRLLGVAKAELGCAPNEENARRYTDILERVFAEFPDDLDALHAQELVYFKYYAMPGKVAEAASAADKSLSLSDLIKAKLIGFVPLVYEDFLPVSAAGIFQSNLGEGASGVGLANSSKAEFEAALGKFVLDEFELYENVQRDSLTVAYCALGITW